MNLGSDTSGHSPVAQVCDLPCRRLPAGRTSLRWAPSAGCKPATRQTGGLRSCARQGLVCRDERSRRGLVTPTVAEPPRPSPQGAGAKGWDANVRQKEHKWAVRPDVGDECASKRELQESLTTGGRARAAKAASHLRSHLQCPRLWLPTGQECSRRGARERRAASKRGRTGGGHGHH
jgi:hypothetical protein